MNLADSATEPPTQDVMLQRHEQQLTFMAEAMQAMAARHERTFENLRDHLLNRPPTVLSPDLTPASATRVQTPPVSDARLPPPERYSGAPGSCRPFLVQCSLAFELQSSAFPTERSRVAYIVSLLTGKAKDWGTAEWERQSLACSSVSLFTDELRKVFDHATPGREIARGLFNLAQGGRSVSDYSIEFRTIAAESNWNASSLLDAFYNGLSDRLKDELAARDLPADLDELVALSICIDSRLRERRKERVFSAAPQAPPRPSAQVPEQVRGGFSNSHEPMQLGRTRLSEAERQRRLQENSCLYCGQDGHFASSCPVKGRAHQSSRGRW